jgi:drug/metabolite transporter (DMT)-like permease
MSPQNLKIAPAGRPLNATAVALMVMLCLSWGFNQISVKLALPDIPPLLQAAIRSTGGLMIILVVAWFRGVRLFQRDGTLKAGLLAGIFFGVEFILIYRGLVYTTASRAVVFLYIAPFVVALGSKRYLGETLSRLQWGGLALSFVGVALAIGVPQPSVDARVILGDLLVMGGGILWAVTTLVVKATPCCMRQPKRRWPIRLRFRFRFWRWERGFGREHHPYAGALAWGLMAYQTIWIVGITFLIWVALVKTYSASKLSSFTFMTPLFGVIGGYFVMHDTLTLAFAGLPFWSWRAYIW